MGLKNMWVIFLLFAHAGCTVAAEGDKSASTISKPSLATLPEAYPSKPGACYVLLKSNEKGLPPVESSENPMCHAVLDNFNMFCNEPPQYERRKLHSTTKDLSGPKWHEIEVKSNPELLKQTYGAVSLPQYREERWQFEGEKVRSLGASGVLRLSRAEVSADMRGGRQTVYMLENSQLGDPVGYNQPRLMFSDYERETPSEIFKLITYQAVADLWSFQNTWFLLRYDVDRKWFTVGELYSSRAGSEAPVVVSTICSIQHINDRLEGK